VSHPFVNLQPRCQLRLTLRNLHSFASALRQPDSFQKKVSLPNYANFMRGRNKCLHPTKLAVMRTVIFQAVVLLQRTVTNVDWNILYTSFKIAQHENRENKTVFQQVICGYKISSKSMLSRRKLNFVRCTANEQRFHQQQILTKSNVLCTSIGRSWFGSAISVCLNKKLLSN